MLIACPRCETVFSLPDQAFKPGKKARCSNCGNTFVMTAPSPVSGVNYPAPGFGQTAEPGVAGVRPMFSRYRKLIMAMVAVLLVLLFALGGWLIVSKYSTGGLKDAINIGDGQSGNAGVDRQEDSERLINSITLDEIRQFLVDNAQIGRLMVIQGIAVNISKGSKDYVAIDARLMDKNGNVLASQRQLCGVPLTLFQLQSLSESEIKESLNNRITILTNNTNIPEGGKVPFVLVFFNPPEATSSFELRVVDVRDSPPAQ